MKTSSDKQRLDMTDPIPISRLFERTEPRRRHSLSPRISHGPAAEIPLFAFISRFLNPTIVASSLALLCLVYGEPFTGYLILGVLAFLISLNVLREAPTVLMRPQLIVLFTSWIIAAAMVLLIAFATGISNEFSAKLITTWLLVTPLLLVAAQHLTRRALATLIPGAARTVLIVGANPLGVEFARRIEWLPNLVDVRGFFDDRGIERLGLRGDRLLGKCSDLPKYLRENPIDVIYISLPPVSKPRILKLLDDLRDSTSSICFIPEWLAFDLTRPRFDVINGLPVLHVRESPFDGVNGAIKRGSDVVICSVILLFIWPALLAIALAAKLAFRGSIFFRQRSCGRRGEEIVIYKFRTMPLAEDTDDPKNDERTSRFGRFLRKTKLDRLPQFINVLQGRLSLVGPEPHTTAETALYRQLLDGYMLRHKVRPGMTGWAQVNGLRGLVESADDMRRRVEYDLMYIRNWSLTLEVEIICRATLTFWR